MDNQLLHAPALARRIGVSCAWLRREADAGRLPHVRAGTRYLFDVEAVERALLARAADDFAHISNRAADEGKGE